MNFCIRIDDIGLRPHSGKDAGLLLARKMHEVMSGVPYLAGVIPGILDASGAKWIRSQPEGMTIALHGWDHSVGCNGSQNEFEELGFSTCCSMLSRGLRIIEGAKPIVDFIPPFNAVTDELLLACRRSGLRNVWGQPYASSHPYRPERKLWGIYMPSWTPLYGMTLWNVPDRGPVIDKLRAMKTSREIAIVVLHLTWEASFSDELKGLKALVTELRPQIVSPHKYIEQAGVKP
jgi:hypothetical protein